MDKHSTFRWVYHLMHAWNDSFSQWTQQAGKRGGGLEKPLVDKVNLRLSVITDQGGDKSLTRGSWSTHMGLMRGCHLSYNLLNKADPSPAPMYPTADCVFNQPPLLSNTSALSFSLSLCPVHQLLQRRADRHNAEKIGCNPCKIAFCGFPLICAQICCFFACYLSCLWRGDAG